MRPPHVGWIFVGATAALTAWGAVALVHVGRWTMHGEVQELRARADALVTDGSGLCRQADVRPKEAARP